LELQVLLNPPSRAVAWQCAQLSARTDANDT
jgi:hypothetical protein